MSEELTTPTVDAEETPQSRHRKKVAREEEARKKAAAVKEEWYQIHGDKLIKVSKMANGNKHRVYICSVKKNKDFVEKLKKTNKIRI